MLLSLYSWHLLTTLPFFFPAFLVPGNSASYWLSSILLNQSEWHNFTVYRKIIPPTEISPGSRELQSWLSLCKVAKMQSSHGFFRKVAPWSFPEVFLSSSAVFSLFLLAPKGQAWRAICHISSFSQWEMRGLDWVEAWNVWLFTSVWLPSLICSFISQNGTSHITGWA